MIMQRGINYEINDNVQRAMAAEAEASREARAKVFEQSLNLFL